VIRSPVLLRDRYEPIEVVGRGGEGRVLRAIDRQHDRQVALKIRPAPAGTARDELLREARVLLSLEPHAGLPLVRDDFFHEDDYVIVMDWIEGVDLDRLLRSEGAPGLAPSTVLGHLAQVAEALGYLHAHDPAVVHGDVKPGNLILTAGGRVVLVDFGLASRGDPAGPAGTPGFVAPEVAAGEPPTRASDVFSLALTAFTLLSGSPPRGGAPEWPTGLDPDRRRVFEEAIRLGSATDPSGRPASAGEFVERLRAGWEADVPTGVVTLCMTDIEGSTALWESHPHTMGAATVRHDAIIAQVVEARGGRLLQSMGEGDSTVSVFTGAGDAVLAASELVGKISEEPWPDGLTIRTRVGLHTGETASRGGDRLGPTAARAARVRALADGGQVFLSRTTAGLVDGQLPEAFDLVDLGAHTLRGFSGPENIFALSTPAVRAPPSPAVCPYRGLLAFEPDDHNLFFGREEVLSGLLDRLASDRFVAVVGASGCGKSSLVRAGVIAAIRQGLLAGVSNAVLITPGANPLAALRAVSDDGVLVIDQFEEVFTICRDDLQRRRFFKQLVAYRGTVLIGLRADFYGHCVAHEGLAQLVSQNNLLLGPMTEAELERAVVAPAEAGGFTLEPGLVELVLRDAAGEPGALPLFSHALMETWARRDGRTLTLAGYRDAGGVSGAIARTAEEVYDRCADDERELMRRVFLRLTELGEGTEDTRRRVSLSELAAGPESATAVAELIDTLTTARLLTLDEGTAQVAHEALIREWPRLRGWLNEDREGLMVHRHLTRSASEWEAAGRDPGALYRGARLAAAIDWAGGHDDLSADERAFLEASRAAEESELREVRRRARRLRGLLAGVAVLLVLALAAGAIALVQRQNARDSAILAQSGRLAAQSREVAGTHPDLGLLLALEGERLDSSVDTRGALLGALEHGSRIRAWLQGFDSPVVASAFSPGGKLLATTTIETTTLWDTDTWKPVGPPLRSSQGGWEEGVDFSPDGRTLAISGPKGRVELWDVSTRKKLRELVDPGASADEPALSVVRYSPDGRIIASGAKATNHVTLWDAATGRVVAGPIITHPPGSGAQSISFSPDSKRIAVPGAPGTVGIWDVTTGQRIGKPLAIGNSEVEEAIFAAGGRILIASDDSGSVSVVDVVTGRPIRRPLSVGSNPAVRLDLSPDGRLLAAASYEGSVFVWDTKTGEPYGTPLTPDTSPVNDVVFSPDGKTLVSSHLDSAVVWNVNGEQAIGGPLGGPADLTTDVSFSPDGKRLAVGRFDGRTILYDTATRRRALRIEVGSPVTAVAYAPGGRLIAVGTIDGRVQLFDPISGRRVGSLLAGGRAAAWQVAFSPDGRLLAVARDPNGIDGFYAQLRQGEVQFWDVDARRRVGRAIVPGGGSVLSIAFSRDGTMLATGSYRGRLDVWDVATRTPRGKPMRVADDGVLGVAFDPSGRLVAGGGATGPVRVWRVADQRPAFPPLTGHVGPVTAVSFDTVGSFLATTSAVGGTRLWDPATGLGYGDELVGSPRPASLTPAVDLPPFLGLRNVFSPDGKLLAVAGVNELGMLWNVDPAVWRQRACAAVGRNLSREEWRLYLPADTAYRKTCSEWPAN
jgi:WD40 repeat protein/class 3 adenylate cyclase/tRNA A-37 threonylcarbamoyl transferase component Bud32